MKVVINTCWGGFGLSKKAIKRLEELTGKGYEYIRDCPRELPELVRVVEELDEEANGACAALKIVDIPDDVSYTIEEYDGKEWVAEEHRTWC